jgi:hypothetical protein
MRELLVGVVGVLIIAWAEMISIGIVHAQVLPAVNPVGYGVALTLTFVAGIAVVVAHIINELLS